MEELDDDLFSGAGSGSKVNATTIKQALKNQAEENLEIPQGEVEFLHDVPLKMIAQIGMIERTMKEVLNLKTHDVVEFDKVVGEPMDVLIGGRLMCRGEIVVVNERYGIRISEVVRADDSDKSEV